MTDFTDVVPALNSALAKRGYDELTPVQKAVLAPELRDADALVSAQTGSGKTVAFGIAIAPNLLGEQDRFNYAEKPLALVVAPTRELALQVKRELDWLYAETGAKIASCVGGMDMRDERRALGAGAHIVVGTPGRLCDHIRRNSLNPSELKAVILDEADEMLDLGFKEELEFIMEATPKDRRTLMFSATVPAAIGKLAKQYQRDAVRVQTAQEEKQHGDIEYRALTVAPRERENAIINILRYYEAENAIVFCNTRATVNHMVARFNNRGFSVVALSGELSQNERTHALQAMRDGRARVCIATDVAARGIDLPKLELVIHADLPNNPETLLHRSGRTGRAGRKGVSAMIVEGKGRNRVERLLRFAKINAEWAAPPSADEVNQRDETRMLENPILTDPLLESEKDFVERLLEGHSAEQVAAAFLRLNKAGRSAPEDLQTVSFEPPKAGKFEKGERVAARREPTEFAESVWISISVGRKQRAEPRWLIPMLCKRGNITKRVIGSIKMQPEETHIQLNAHVADVFFDAIGGDMTLEKNIRVKRLDGEPKGGGGDAAPRRDKPSYDKSRTDRPKSDKASIKKDGAKKDGPDKHWEKPKRKDAPAKPFKNKQVKYQDIAAEVEAPKQIPEGDDAPPPKRKPKADVAKKDGWAAKKKTKKQIEKGKAKKARKKQNSMGGKDGSKPLRRKP